MALSLSANVVENEITAMAAGGTGNLTYSIDGENFQMNNVFSDLANGTYTVTVQDENACTVSTSATISVNTLAVSANLVNDISCADANDGSLEVSVAGGTAPYEYSLNEMGFQSSPIFENLAAGSYTVTVRDAEGFTIETNSATITNPDVLSLSANVDENEITATATGGTGEWTYSINGGDFQNNNVFDNLPNGDYQITVQDENGCTATTTVTVDVIQPLVILTSITTNLTCNNSDDGSITIQASGGVEPYMYSLNGGDFQSNNTFGNLTAGTYEVVLMDANGTMISTTELAINNPEAISFTAGIVDNNINISNVAGGTGDYTLSLIHI